ncbi:hypothetical protein OG548_20680 [Streptomyces sp. NBC_01356]|uniref:hypothetical protein n=1 Tax=Streptomyces sp. NBC_01356 TaxID=2903836 RepID=UPI002E32CBC1|nr:hypothetical protein [Streptomyces sp. NBC_01356]
MTSTSRPRFSVRVGLAEDIDDAPFDGVPGHLQRPLQNWVSDLFSPTRGIGESAAEYVCTALRITVLGRETCSARLRRSEGVELLDVVDELLGNPSWVRSYQLELLGGLLNAAGSAYQLSEEGDALEERIVPAVRDAVRNAVDEAAANSTAGSAAEHLATAWRAVYGRQPDPVRGYSEAIKAVESAAHHVIQSNHARATLGTMLGEIGNARPKFTTVIDTPVGKDAITPIEAMMRALWDGQTSRHGNKSGTVPESLEAARAGVHLAACLVQWFSSGAVARNP